MPYKQVTSSEKETGYFNNARQSATSNALCMKCAIRMFPNQKSILRNFDSSDFVIGLIVLVLLCKDTYPSLKILIIHFVKPILLLRTLVKCSTTASNFLRVCSQTYYPKQQLKTVT